MSKPYETLMSFGEAFGPVLGSVYRVLMDIILAAGACFFIAVVISIMIKIVEYIIRLVKWYRSRKV